MPLLPADLIRPWLQHNLRITIDTTATGGHFLKISGEKVTESPNKTKDRLLRKESRQSLCCRNVLQFEVCFLRKRHGERSRLLLSPAFRDFSNMFSR